MIGSLNEASIKSDCNYFFDANVWLKVLKKANPDSRDRKYITFFEDVATFNRNAKIVVTSSLLSEIINRYLRDVSMALFAKKQGEIMPLHSSYYKMKYRQSQQFAIDYEILADDIKAYHGCLKWVNDGFGVLFTAKEILKSPPKGLDFNDNLMVKLARHHNFTIVTDDIDFFIEDIPVLTLNKNLLQKAQSA